MTIECTRREWLAAVSTAGAAIGTTIMSTNATAQERSVAEPFGYCLNTSTLGRQKIPIKDEIDIASRAGYHGLEPWIRELDDFVKQGGNLKDLKKRLEDGGLRVESTIGFFEWVVDDDEKRKKALEEARRNFDMVQQIGGKRLAAPPVGATNQSNLDLSKAAERYRALLELGDQFGVVPEVELWGFSKSLHRLGEVAYVAIESGHPKACILADVYHLYKGGSSFDGLKFLNGTCMHVLHFNDYPAKPSRAEITDAHRVYPGDGVAPLKTILQDLRAIGFRGMLSLELFNRDYWNQDPLTVARTGLDKMKAVVHASLDKK